MLKRDKRDAMALFYLGGVHGRQAILAGLEAKHVETVTLALDGRKYIKRLHKYHPDAEDAYFGLGLYDYYAAQLPWFGRILGRLFLGLSGNTERGIAQLERASRHGLFTQVEARLFLAIIYLDAAQRYEDAISILEELHARFPGNLDFYGMLGHAYRTVHDYASAIHVLEMLVDKADSNPAFGNRSRALVHYFLGSTHKVAGNFEAALEQLDRAVTLAGGGDNNWLLASSHLERGRVHDLLGRRADAVANYEAVLATKNFRGSHDKASRLLDAPYVALPEETRHYLTANASASTHPDPRKPAKGRAHSDSSEQGEPGRATRSGDGSGRDRPSVGAGGGNATASDSKYR
jgi:tetratricopeptide (TPR) repeat protein